MGVVFPTARGEGALACIRCTARVGLVCDSTVGPGDDSVGYPDCFQVGFLGSYPTSKVLLEFVFDLTPEPIKLFVPSEYSKIVTMYHTAALSFCALGCTRG